MAIEKSKQVSNKNMTWSTQIVDNWLRDHADGTFHKENPWLDGQVGIKRAGLSF